MGIPEVEVIARSSGGPVGIPTNAPYGHLPGEALHQICVELPHKAIMGGRVLGQYPSHGQGHTSLGALRLQGFPSSAATHDSYPFPEGCGEAAAIYCLCARFIISDAVVGRRTHER